MPVLSFVNSEVLHEANSQNLKWEEHVPAIKQAAEFSRQPTDVSVRIKPG